MCPMHRQPKHTPFSFRKSNFSRCVHFLNCGRCSNACPSVQYKQETIFEIVGDILCIRVWMLFLVAFTAGSVDIKTAEYRMVYVFFIYSQLHKFSIVILWLDYTRKVMCAHIYNSGHSFVGGSATHTLVLAGIQVFWSSVSFPSCVNRSGTSCGVKRERMISLQQLVPERLQTAEIQRWPQWSSFQLNVVFVKKRPPQLLFKLCLSIQKIMKCPVSNFTIFLLKDAGFPQTNRAAPLSQL